MSRIELLAPAGSLEKLKFAFAYGADACYIGGRNYSLRANATNFSLEEIKEACDYAHSINKKVYVTVNIVFHDEDTEGIIEYLKKLSEYKVDAIIVSDPLIIDVVNDNNIDLKIHISTQASTLNYEAVNFWKSLGVERVVLARELSKSEIKEIIDRTGVEVETFVHGAMCSSYSGRCVLSNYFTNRDSNRGGCSQICRWNFGLYDNEKEISKDEFAITVKDLSMINYIKDLIDMGITSLKIEGRMRSIYYIATVLNVYRKVIDEYYEKGTISNISKYSYELFRCANRDSVPQFFKEKPGVNEQYYLTREEPSNKDFLGVVLDYNKETKEITLEQRNYFKKGDEITVFGPNTNDITIKVEYIKNEKDEYIEVANHPQEIVKINCETEVFKNDLIRVKF